MSTDAISEQEATEPLPGTPGQAEFFSLADLKDQPHLVERAKEFRHTGKISGKDDLVVHAILRLAVAGVPSITIARRLKVSPNTVRAIVNLHAGNDSQELEQVKKAQAARMAELVALSQEHLIDRLIAGKVPDAVANAVMGTAADKLAILTGQPTQILSVKRGASPEELEAELREILARTAIPVVAAVDEQSTAHRSNAEESSGLEQFDTAFDTTEAPPRHHLAPPGADADPAVEQAPDPPGGGSPSSNRSPTMDRLPDPV